MITVKDANGKTVGHTDEQQLVISDRRLKTHLEKVMRFGIPVGPDANIRGKPGIGLLLDYLNRMGYTLEVDEDIKKAPGISESGSESPDPGHVIGDSSPGLRGSKSRRRL
jgi:hypothetical protein